MPFTTVSVAVAKEEEGPMDISCAVFLEIRADEPHLESLLTCKQPPNHRFDRSAQRRRRWVPVALRASAPGQANCWTSDSDFAKW